MAGLDDIGPIEWEISVGKNKVTGAGLSAYDIFALANKYPALGVMLGIGAMTGAGEKGVEKPKLDAAKLFASLPDCAWNMIAIATGDAKDEKTLKSAIAKCRKLSFVTQVQLLQNVLRATIGEGGIGPFVDAVNEITATMTISNNTAQDPAEASQNTSQNSSPAAVVIDLPMGRPGRRRRAS